MSAHPLSRAVAPGGVALLVLALAACSGGGSSSSSSSAPAAAGSSSASAESSSAPAAFPVTITNCGSEVTLEHEPERILLVNNDSIANLEALGAIDRVVGVTATPQEGLYEPATYTALAALPVLSTTTNSTGGSIVSQEAILGATPDLVIAPENAVDRAALAAAGIAVYSPTAYCADPPAELKETATFDRVWDELATYGELLGVPEKAAEVVSSAKREIAGLGAPDAGTAVALYVSSGGAVLSPYGGPSMVTPIFEAAGLTNVYADSDQRVFDASLEDITSRDPGTIVLLSSGDPEATRAAFLSAPGVDGLTAVRNNRVVTLAFPYTDPPTVLSTRGPAQLIAALAAL